MSDFTWEGLSSLLLVVVIVSILLCAILLIVQSRQRVRVSSDEHTNSTGHVWDDDLKELNNPMPRWWMWLFQGTVVFGLTYLWLYPGLGGFVGLLDWTSSREYQAERTRLEEQANRVYAQFASLDTAQLARNPQAMAIGERLFLNHCAQCHGSDARGSKGFPNLTDTDWLYGGTPEAIAQSISAGRRGMMPPMIQAVGNEQDARAVAQYVLSLSGRENDTVKAQLGREKFKSVCVGCHGADGHGNALLGAPNLADSVWLHGGTETAIVETIKRGRSGEMPAHADKLTPEQTRVLTAWVWSRSQPALQVAEHDSTR